VLFHIVLIIHMLCILLCVVLRPFGIVVVPALGLNKLVHFSCREASEKLLCKGVRDRFACLFCVLEKTKTVRYRGGCVTLFTLVVFKELETPEGGGPSDELVREFGLVLVPFAAIPVYLLMGISRFICIDYTIVRALASCSSSW
jgi:hypothetical protein